MFYSVYAYKVGGYYVDAEKYKTDGLARAISLVSQRHNIVEYGRFENDKWVVYKTYKF